MNTFLFMHGVSHLEAMAPLVWYVSRFGRLVSLKLTTVRANYLWLINIVKGTLSWKCCNSKRLL